MEHVAEGDVGNTVDISIVIAAYNAEHVLGRAIESVIAQTYPLERMQLIVVDDCSADATGDVIERYRRDYPDLVCVERTDIQTGSPAAPRNRGIEVARGEYVFFLDADDWLGPEAVERMLGYARKWRSDLLLVKLRGEGGRPVPQSMFKNNRPQVDIYRSKVLWTFGPYKLYRRALVKDIRFPAFMPEDISFVLRAYVRAQVVSVAADYDYYHLAYVEGPQGNISLSTWDDVDSNLDAYEDVFGFIAENVARRDQDGVLLRRLFKRDVCNTLRTIARDCDVARAQRHLCRLVRIVGPFWRPWLSIGFPSEDRKLLRAAFESR